ncbi:glycoside hydrolase family 35 protein [Moniliophthora roreri]|nr:glycoside hydrolase family 35 protein [Moniliophthora roreri]
MIRILENFHLAFGACGTLIVLPFSEGGVVLLELSPSAGVPADRVHSGLPSKLHMASSGS